MEIEIWKDVKGYEGAYQVSSFGKVRSLERWVIHPINGKQFWPARIRKQKMNKGYMIVSLSKQSKKFMAKVHRLVCEDFHPNPDNKPEVNHDDTNKANNFASNVGWATRSENAIHAFANGCSKSPNIGGVVDKTRKLDKRHYAVIKDLYSTGLFSHSMIANMFSVSKFLVWNVTSGRKKIKNAA